MSSILQEEIMHRVTRILRPPFYLLLMAFLFCAGMPDALAGDTIRINGSGTCLEMMKPLMKAYGKVSRGVSFNMEKPLGSSGAIKALLDGALDIAVVARPLKPEEIARGGKLKPFGKTPLVIVTEKRTPLKTITTRELEDVYAGRTLKWSNGETIRIILRPNEETDTKILKHLSPGMAEAITKAHQRRGLMIAMTDPESIEAVSRIAGGIGTSTLTHVLVGKLPLKVIDLNGVKPSRKTLKDGAYPLAKEISFVTTDRLPNAASRFLEFVYSKKGRAITEKYGVLITIDGK
jgi:phosphate transport system substrate-binding protein